jgi:hypothetical protein
VSVSLTIGKIELKISCKDKLFNEKLRDIKRLLLHVKLQQSPLELKNNCAKKIAADKKSNIPKWIHPSKHVQKTVNEKPTPKKKPGKNTSNGVKPYITNLIVDVIKPLNNIHDSSRPYRRRFEHEYEKCYQDMAKERIM